jgi:AAA domain-containing protein/bifunctional DNA primase/polymerase-like protein/primase-like protein
MTDSTPYQDISTAATFYIERAKLPLGVVYGTGDRKRPVGGQDNWTRKPERIAELIGQHAGCGLFFNLAVSHYVDLDLDVRSRADFRPGLARLEEQLGQLPPTWTIITPTGGEHRIFTAPAPLDGLKAKTDLAAHVELKIGGTCPLPPSKHYTGGLYAWKAGCAPWEIHRAELPAAWFERARNRRRERRQHAPPEDPIPEGQRHTELLSLAGAYVNAGQTGDVLGAALHAVNESRCKPPLPAADVDAIVTSATERWTRRKPPEQMFGPPGPKNGQQNHGSPRFKATKPDKSTFKPVRWAWAGMVPLGKFSMLVGEEGIGKGTLLAHLAARWTKGELDGNLHGAPAAVLFLAEEDGFEDTIGPRLMAAGADFEHIRHVEPVTEDGAPLVIPEDVDELRRLIVENEARIVIVDPLDEFTDASVDGWKAKAVRHALAPARKVAQDTGSALLAVRHLNKSASSNVRDRISDSHVYNALSRSTLLVALDNEDRESAKRYVAASKRNLTKHPLVLEFSIEEKIVAPREVPIGVSAVVGLKPSDKAASELLAKPSTGTQLERAKEIIREHLPDQKPHPVEPIKAALEAAGISESTGERAKRELKVKTTRGDGKPPVFYWTRQPFMRDEGQSDEGLSEGAVGLSNGAVEPDQALAAATALHQSDGEGLSRKPAIRRRPGGARQPTTTEP